MLCCAISYDVKLLRESSVIHSVLVNHRRTLLHPIPTSLRPRLQYSDSLLRSAVKHLCWCFFTAGSAKWRVLSLYNRCNSPAPSCDRVPTSCHVTWQVIRSRAYPIHGLKSGDESCRARAARRRGMLGGGIPVATGWGVWKKGYAPSRNIFRFVSSKWQVLLHSGS